MKKKEFKLLAFFLLSLISLLPISSAELLFFNSEKSIEKEMWLDEIINNKIESGYYEILGYKGNIIILDFKNRAVQNNMLGRITLFVEDREHNGKIVDFKTVEEKKKHLLAHNLKPEDIAKFFNKAELENIKLSSEESELKKILLEKQFIEKETNTNLLKGKQKTALISTHHDKDLLIYRTTIITHELEHALDFTDAEHWKKSKKVWNSLNTNQKETFKKFLNNIGIYDTSDKDLVITEFRAFTHTKGDYSYFNYIDDLKNLGLITSEEQITLKSLEKDLGLWDEYSQIENLLSKVNHIIQDII